MNYYYYDLVDYDLWGNARDGFEVNDAFVVERDIVMAESIVKGSDKELIRALKDLNIIKKGIHCNSIEIDGDPEHSLYFNDVRQEVGGFCPAFELICTKVI